MILQNSSPASALAGVLTNTNDEVRIALPGGDWATAKVTFDGVWNGTVQQEYSDDGGFNWKTAPYAKRLDAVAANPSVTATIVSAAVASVWEVPVPGNCTHFRVRQTAGSVAGKVTVAPFVQYNPDIPVVAVLYDVTEGSIGAGLATTQDTSGWGPVQVDFSTPTTQVWTVRVVDDTGTAFGPSITTTATTSSSLLMSENAPAGGPGPIGTGVAAVWPFIDRRFSLTLPAGGTVSTGRARIVARR